MFKYQIYKLSKGGKEARAVMLEDILTSDVFGLMTYFPYELMLKPFLDQLCLKNMESLFSVPVTAPNDVNFWKSFNWPEYLPYLYRESIEPDVVIEWDDILLIVEAKFISPTDPEELLREYLVGANKAGSGKRFYLLLIDKNLSAPTVSIPNSSDKMSVSRYIERRIHDLEISHLFPTEKIHSSVLWTNWQNCYILVERLLQKNSHQEWQILKKQCESILKDLLHILDRKGLIPFQPLPLHDFKKWQIDLNLLGELGLKLRSSFSDLSDIAIDIDCLGEIGLMLRSSFTDLSDITIDLDCLGNIGLKLNDHVPFLSGLQIDIAELNNFLNL